MVSETVIILEFAWKPLWVTIISENSAERSTFEDSSAEDCSRPVPSVPGTQRLGVPEFAVAEK